MLMTGERMKDIIEEDYPWAMPHNSDEAMNKLILERSQTDFRKSPPRRQLIRCGLHRSILTTRTPTDPCGSLRMGKDIEQGVVDNKLRVFVIESLRVIDASVIPVIPDCRIQNSVYMIGEKWRGLHQGCPP